MSKLGCVDSVKQITEAKEGPLELRRRKAGMLLEGRKGEGKVWAQERERQRQREGGGGRGREQELTCTESFVLRVLMNSLKAGILWEVSGEELSGIFTSFPGVFLSGLWSLVIGQHQGRRSLVIASGSDISHGIASSAFAAFQGLKLKHS